MGSMHSWKFFRAGGFDQARLDRGEDLLALRQLDQKLWVALSCPIAGTEFDAGTLALLDADGDGHIRAPELLAAIDWVAARLNDPSVLVDNTGELPLAAIDASRPEGQRILASARRILDNLGKAGASIIAVDDAADSARIFGDTRFNGDGVISAKTAGDAALATLIDALAGAYGATVDRCGEAGISEATLTQAITDAEATAAWESAAANADGLSDPAAALAALAGVRGKIDDYFSRCRLAAYDARAEALLNGSDDDFLGFAAADLAIPGDAVARLPLARIAAGQPLPLDTRLNPAWSAAMATFVETVVTPLLGPQTGLDEDQWRDLCNRLEAVRTWRAAEPQTPLQSLDGETRTALLAQADVLKGLMADDLAVAEEAAAIDEVAKLTRLCRDLLPFANNFAAFKGFYHRTEKASFQSGTLYLDGRSADLCIDVVDPVRHGTLATLSRICLAYCDCVRGGEKRTIAAAFTSGDIDQLMIGRNGVFYDRQGRDWDATIVKLIDHPISLRQAFWAPYRKLARFAGEQMQKFAAAKAQASEAAATKQLVSGAKVVETPAAAGKAPPPAFDVGKFAGIFAAIGLAIGAIGTALAAVITGFLGLVWWQMPLALAGIVLLISGPSVAVAWFKLRARTLGPILDANGWAINARACINIPFGTSLTQRAQLPPGAVRALTDPYAEARTPWPLYLVLGALLAAALYALTKVS